MRAVDQWAQIQGNLPDGWTEARIAFEPEEDASRAATILAPLAPGRVGNGLRIHVTRSGSGAERTRNVLGRLDEQRVWGTLRLLGTDTEPLQPEPGEPEARATAGLAEGWDELQAQLPPDWSDVLCELDLDSSDHVPRATLLGAPLNPARVPGRAAIRFRASGGHGYGTSQGMVRRCLERMDADGVTGRISVVLGLSDSDHAATQGPVWRVAGRSV
jgi:hypothetical protein